MPHGSKILFLDHTTEPGGAELALRRLVENAPANSDIVVMTPHGEPGLFESASKFRHAMIGPAQLPGAATGRGISRAAFFRDILRQASAVRRSVEFRHAEMVVTNTSRSAVYAWLAMLGSRKKRIVYLRDEVSTESLGEIGYRALRMSLRSASAVVANSHFTLSTAKPHLKAGARALVIPSPVGMSIRPIGERKTGPVTTIGMVARIDSWKGHALLIRAFARAFPTSNTVLHLAGGPLFGGEPLLRELQEIAQESGVGDRVVFLGHVRDVADFVDKMDICVQASIRPEPLGQNVLQYLVRRCPVVVSNSGGPAEWIREGVNGILFEEGNEESLAKALLKLGDDIGLRERISTRDEISVPSDVEIAKRFFNFLGATAAASPRGAGVP